VREMRLAVGRAALDDVADVVVEQQLQSFRHAETVSPRGSSEGFPGREPGRSGQRANELEVPMFPIAAAGVSILTVVVILLIIIVVLMLFGRGRRRGV
jgi:hypothetical protein